MKICVYGAGAIGGHIAGRLGTTGAEVSVVARGEQLAAIRKYGLRVQTHDAELVSHPVATDRPADLGPQDVVIVAVKAPALPGIAEQIGSLLHDESQVLFVTNGIPWWYFHAHGGKLDGTHLQRLDPDQLLWKHVGPERTVGAVAQMACTVVKPGVVRAAKPRNILRVGRADGMPDERLDALAALLRPSGLDLEISPNFRNAVWAKLLMNMVGGSLAVLTASPMKYVLDDPAILRTAKAMAAEGAAIASALGCDAGDPEAGFGTLSNSQHLQSIAHDLLTGRKMEIDAVFRVPLDLAALAGVPTPTLDLIIGLATRRARVAGLYEDSGR